MDIAHPGNRTVVNNVGGYYDTTSLRVESLTSTINHFELNPTTDGGWKRCTSKKMFCRTSKQYFSVIQINLRERRVVEERALKGVKSEVKMRLVGLTGGIASGKSTVSNLFKSCGIPVVDADIVARDVVKKGTGGYKKIVETFGVDILQANGEIDRTKLGQIVFSDPAKRQLLNRLLVPYISSGIFWEILKLWLKGYEVIVLDIPLLFEAKMDKWTKPIVVVWVDPETQLQRVVARDKSSEEDAKNRISSQMPLDLKREKADIVIDNTGSLEDLEEQFKKVLFQVMRPLTWNEFWLSRRGAVTALVSIVVGVVVGKGFSKL